ncbi:hypothetical protein Tco_1205288 [Tanacetum coccineum]
MMSNTVFVDPKISTQANGAQSSRVPVPLPEPYEAIRQAYLVGTDTESKPFEDLETESESPHTITSPISLPDGTPHACHVEESKDFDTSGMRSTSSDSTAPLSPDHPLTHATLVLVPYLCRTVRMAVCGRPAMSPGCSAYIAKVAAMSDVVFRKRFRSSYESSPSPSPTLLVHKRYRGTFEPILDTDSGEDVDEDEGDESLDEGDEGHELDDESRELEDESHSLDDEGRGVESDRLGLKEEATPKGQQRAALVVETAASKPLGLGYAALKR